MSILENKTLELLKTLKYTLICQSVIQITYQNKILFKRIDIQISLIIRNAQSPDVLEIDGSAQNG